MADGGTQTAGSGIVRTPHSAFRIPLSLFIPLLLLLPILWAYVPGGLPSTADSQVHFIRAAEMVHAWGDGVLLPRWSANLGVGLGIPLFNFAPPLPYLLTALFHTAGLPLAQAFAAMTMVALLVAALGAYRLGSELLGPWAGAVCGAAILYAPIYLRELFIQGNIGQLLAWAFVPWTFWAVLRIYGGTGWRAVVPLALAILGATLSHNAVALMAAELASLQIAVLFLFTRQGRHFFTAVAGIALGLALGAWFWLPALVESQYIQLDKIVASDFRTRFLPLAELVAWSPRLDMRAINPYYPLTIGAVQLLLGALGGVALVALILLWRRRGQAGTGQPAPPTAPGLPVVTRLTIGAGVYFAGLALFGAFMALAPSAPLWDLLPFMDLFEFPFRWHGITVVALGWLAGLGVYFVQAWRPRLGAIYGATATALLLGSALVNLYPDKLGPEPWAWTPQAVVAYEVATGQVGTTSLSEFNPVWVNTLLQESSPFAAGYPAAGAPDRLPPALPPGLAIIQTSTGVQRYTYAVTATAASTLTFNLLYFPGWTAAVDGAPVPLAPRTALGLLSVELPSGAYELELAYTGTWLQQLGTVVALGAWVMVAGILLTMVRRRGGTSPLSMTSSYWGTLGVIAVLVLGILVLRELAPGWFRLNSPPGQALPARVPMTAVFAGQVRVLGVDPPPAAVAPGATLGVTAYLEATGPLTTSYGLFLHLDQPDGTTIAAVDSLHPDDIPTAHWPGGLYVRAPMRLTVPADALPMRYDLHLGMTDPATGEWLALDDNGARQLHVGSVWVTPGVQPEPPAARPAATQFGAAAQLLAAELDPAARLLRLYWRSEAPAEQELAIFVHFLDADGKILAQADGLPYGGQYAVADWQPGQIILDERPWPAQLTAARDLAAVAIGLFDPATGVRLPATNAEGARLPDDAVRVVCCGE